MRRGGADSSAAFGFGMTKGWVLSSTYGGITRVGFRSIHRGDGLGVTRHACTKINTFADL
jgi:hypothetical protein